jgi:hypothetical protein
MLVSSVKMLSLVQGVAVQWPSADIPTLFHGGLEPFPGGLLLRSQYAPAGGGRKPGNRLAVAGDDEFLACLDRADVAGEDVTSNAMLAREQANTVRRQGFGMKIKLVTVKRLTS